MFIVGMFLLIPFLLPFVAGMLLGLGIRKTRSDLLALLAGLSTVLLQSIIMKRLGLHHEPSLYLLSQTVPSTTILLLCILSSISMRIIFPYIFARWGVELIDRIRAKNTPTTRHNSKGNLILGIMVAILFVASFAQTIPIMTSEFHKAREKTVKNRDITKSSNATSNSATVLDTLTGVVIRKGWTKSMESWDAGGSEYYVLKVEDAGLPADKRSAGEGVILRPSEAIPFEHFTNFVGQTVTCRGVFVAGKPYIPPEDSEEQMPNPSRNPVTGEMEYPIVGSGFKVQFIDVAEKK